MRGLKNIYLSFFSKIAIALLIFTICRLLFYFFNAPLLGDLQFRHLLGGLHIDIMTVSILYGPFTLGFLFLLRIWPKVVAFLFHLATFIGLSLNCIDFEYFQFTLKRTSADLFRTQGIGNDFINVLPSYLLDFWYIIALIAVLFALSIWAYRKSEKIQREAISTLQYFGFIVPILILSLIGSRGGLQLRPLSVLSASQYADSNAVPTVLNTPFTLIKSLNDEDLELVTYLSQAELDATYSPIHHFEADSQALPLNVVVLIAESFSKEYMGLYGNSKSYTPFLDSLLAHSLYFDHAYANGKKSIEALPAILSGIPSLMNSSFISGQYASNQIESLAKSLGQQGYVSKFYHGGENGTMGFNSFCDLAGIGQYLGQDEYPDQNNYDGNWGIFDEPFLQFCAADLKAMKEPFLASIFTLSSHHPYTIPDQYKNRFKEGPHPILKSIEYADYSLSKFFDSIKNEAWFENTLFVITADHTAPPISKRAGNRVGIYEIPLAFYCPKYIQPERNSRTTQQCDIFPSLVDFLGHSADFLSFGNSVFDKKAEPFAINYLNESFQLIQGDFSLLFDGERVIGLYQISADPEITEDVSNQFPQVRLKMEKLMQAIVQQFKQRMIQNSMKFKP